MSRLTALPVEYEINATTSDTEDVRLTNPSLEPYTVPSGVTWAPNAVTVIPHVANTETIPTSCVVVKLYSPIAERGKEPLTKREGVSQTPTCNCRRVRAVTTYLYFLWSQRKKKRRSIFQEKSNTEEVCVLSTCRTKYSKWNIYYSLWCKAIS